MIVSLYWVQYCGSFFPDPMSRYSLYSRYSNTINKMLLMITKNMATKAVAAFALKTRSSGIPSWRQGCRQAQQRSSAQSELRRRYLMLSQTFSTLFCHRKHQRAVEYYRQAREPNCDKKKCK